MYFGSSVFYILDNYPFAYSLTYLMDFHKTSVEFQDDLIFINPFSARTRHCREIMNTPVGLFHQRNSLSRNQSKYVLHHFCQK
jgi:hypothetical protein